MKKKKGKNLPLIFLILTFLSTALIFLYSWWATSGPRATGGGLGRSMQIAWLCIFSLIVPFLLALAGWICGAITLSENYSVGKLIATIINALIVIAFIILIILSVATA